MRFYNLAFVKACFDLGYGETSILKYALAGMGFATRSPKTVFLIAAAYGIFSLIIGFIMYKVGYVDAKNEVQNRFNPFQKEVRDKLLKEKKFK